jgi:hypothetical protein
MSVQLKKWQQIYMDIEQIMMGKFLEYIRFYGHANRRSFDGTTTGHQWDRRIKRSLLELGRQVWPNNHSLGIFPFPSFRLRHESRPEKKVWWIERDIPPYDRYRCAAYGVELSLQCNGQSFLTIRDGLGDRTLVNPTINALEKALSQAARNPAMMIPRRFGIADE